METERRGGGGGGGRGAVQRTDRAERGGGERTSPLSLTFSSSCVCQRAFFPSNSSAPCETHAVRRIPLGQSCFPPVQLVSGLHINFPSVGMSNALPVLDQNEREHHIGRGTSPGAWARQSSGTTSNLSADVSRRCAPLLASAWSGRAPLPLSAVWGCSLCFFRPLSAA